MHPNFSKVIESLHPAYERLMDMEALEGTPPLRQSTPKSGVYLFSEKGRHLYVGRSNRIFERYKLHTGVSATHNQASFAWEIMAEVVGHKATYRKGEGRGDPIQRKDYASAFAKAKTRIREMEFRFVEENDQRRQSLLESYVCIALETPYNDFNTH